MNKFPNIRKNIFSTRFVLIYLVALILLSGKIHALSSDEDGLNLLIITIDTLRADHTGIYGYEKIKTPHVDGLGQKGVLFTHAFCHVPLTLPSHCSLFTGNLPVFHGVRDNGYRLPAFNITLAEILKEKEY